MRVCDLLRYLGGVVAGAVALAGLAACSSQPSTLPPDRAIAMSAAKAQAGCSTHAVFVRLDTEIRGYPLFARGTTVPCALISGPNTQLLERGAIAVSVNGFLHSLSFQAQGTNSLTIHLPGATGNVAPSRVANADQDHVALAVDSHVNDFVVASEGYAAQRCWYVIPNHATTFAQTNCDDALAAIHALTTNDRDELLVAGTDAKTGAGRIDVFDSPATAASHLVRSIEGPATGIVSLSGSLGYYDVSFSLATDPTSGAIYLYDHLFNDLGGGAIAGAPPAKISEFAANAAGNVAPLRTLAGPNVQLVDDSFAVNVLGVDYQGQLYAVARGSTVAISVFGPSQSGNAAPERTISDPSGSVGSSGDAIAVRSSV